MWAVFSQPGKGGLLPGYHQTRTSDVCGFQEASGSLICFTEKLFYPQPGSWSLTSPPFQIFSAEYLIEMGTYFLILLGGRVGLFSALVFLKQSRQIFLYCRKKRISLKWLSHWVWEPACSSSWLSFRWPGFCSSDLNIIRNEMDSSDKVPIGRSRKSNHKAISQN